MQKKAIMCLIFSLLFLALLLGACGDSGAATSVGSSTASIASVATPTARGVDNLLLATPTTSPIYFSQLKAVIGEALAVDPNPSGQLPVSVSLNHLRAVRYGLDKSEKALIEAILTSQSGLYLLQSSSNMEGFPNKLNNLDPQLMRIAIDTCLLNASSSPWSSDALMITNKARFWQALWMEYFYKNSMCALRSLTTEENHARILLNKDIIGEYPLRYFDLAIARDGIDSLQQEIVATPSAYPLLNGSALNLLQRAPSEFEVAFIYAQFLRGHDNTKDNPEKVSGLDNIFYSGVDYGLKDATGNDASTCATLNNQGIAYLGLGSPWFYPQAMTLDQGNLKFRSVLQGAMTGPPVPRTVLITLIKKNPGLKNLPLIGFTSGISIFWAAILDYLSAHAGATPSDAYRSFGMGEPEILVAEAIRKSVTIK